MQQQKNGRNLQVLDIADDLYDEDDADIQRILRRLVMAAADATMRHDMNVEDEYFSIIEKRDTEILMRDRELAEKDTQLKKMAQMLLKSGLSPESIAESLGEDLATVRRLTDS